MNKLFENFKNEEVKVTSENAVMEGTVRFSGSLRLVKGEMSETVSFDAQSYLMNKYCDDEHKLVGLEDYDFYNRKDALFNGMPIDNVVKFRKTLEDSGLKTISDGLKFGNESEVMCLALAVQSSTLFKSVYGGDARCWESFLPHEKEVILLRYCIKNYDSLTVGNFPYLLRKHLLAVQGKEENKKELPSIDSLKDLFQETIR
tara:strand:+ start:464 stop:1069 length:606 start_codon:yes stop_codon:yes gene_type:complete